MIFFLSLFFFSRCCATVRLILQKQKQKVHSLIRPSVSSSSPSEPLLQPRREHLVDDRQGFPAAPEEVVPPPERLSRFRPEVFFQSRAAPEVEAPDLAEELGAGAGERGPDGLLSLPRGERRGGRSRSCRRRRIIRIRARTRSSADAVEGRCGVSCVPPARRVHQRLPFPLVGPQQDAALDQRAP